MIEILDKEILVSTAHTSLVLSHRYAEKLVISYYGQKLISKDEVSSLVRRYPYGQGNEASLDEKDNVGLSENELAMDVSVMGHSDFFSPSLVLERPESATFDLVFEKAEAVKPSLLPDFPTPHGASEELVITLAEKLMAVQVEIHYVVFDKEDVIGKYLVVHNLGETPLAIRKAMSLTLCLVNHSDTLVSTYGTWAGELNLSEETIHPGKKVLESLSGSSSSRHNPFFMVKEKYCTPMAGVCYGFNLVYSGNHEESVEMDAFSNLRIQSGIASTGFNYSLPKNEAFTTPMAVMTYSASGTNGLAQQMSVFVTEHILPVAWKDKPRPIVYNNWEATFMKFTKGKLVSLMKKAKALGIELFVLDDGWFSTRNDDQHGLGNWECNTKKLPGGLKALANEAKKLGLQFGIWMEPEMVNDDAPVYKEHPDWIIRDGIHTPLKGRHQFTLDLSKKEVQDFVVDSVSKTLASAPISYLKWDYNRNMTDLPRLDYSLGYLKGLYSVLTRIMTAFPDVLFENCASGGNRFDLGMLSFFAQSWMSDDTDSYQREKIQGGASFGYPLSVMSNHVAAKTSNQLLRKTPLDDKFDVACFGILGYELDLNDLYPADKKVISQQTAFYKEHRKTLQFGALSLLNEEGEDEDRMIQAQSDEETLVGLYKKLQKPAPKEAHLQAFGLKEDTLYEYQTRQHSFPLQQFGNLVNMVAPVHLSEDGVLVSMLAKHVDMKGEVDKGVVSGAALLSGGPVLSQEWSGVGYDDRIRLMGDFGTRLYVIKEKK
jgi:alpha-galactosidase